VGPEWEPQEELQDKLKLSSETPSEQTRAMLAENKNLAPLTSKLKKPLKRPLKKKYKYESDSDSSYDSDSI
jgi:hypothetical protein